MACGGSAQPAGRPATLPGRHAGPVGRRRRLRARPPRQARAAGAAVAPVRPRGRAGPSLYVLDLKRGIDSRVLIRMDLRSHGGRRTPRFTPQQQACDAVRLVGTKVWLTGQPKLLLTSLSVAFVKRHPELTPWGCGRKRGLVRQPSPVICDAPWGSEEALAGGVVWRACLAGHRTREIRASHPVEPARPTVVTAAIGVHTGRSPPAMTISIAASSIVLTSSASGRVPMDQLTTIPSKQSIIGER